MKRLHVHVNVTDLNEAVAYYGALFGAVPTIEKPGYAKWLLDEPRVNFAISQGAGAAGLSHLGIQAESGTELESLSGRLAAAEEPLVEQKNALCCYARGDKYWGRDPAGIEWELFHTHEQIDTFGDSTVRPVAEEKPGSGKVCC